jgi:hypothetical protein
VFVVDEVDGDAAEAVIGGVEEDVEGKAEVAAA